VTSASVSALTSFACSNRVHLPYLDAWKRPFQDFVVRVMSAPSCRQLIILLYTMMSCQLQQHWSAPVPPVYQQHHVKPMLAKSRFKAAKSTENSTSAVKLFNPLLDHAWSAGTYQSLSLQSNYSCFKFPETADLCLEKCNPIILISFPGVVLEE